MAIKFRPEQLKAYFICGTQDVKTDGASVQTILAEALKAGITAFQFREKGPKALTGQAKLELAQELNQLCGEFGVPFIVDDDVELAKQVGADGIHVGQKDQLVSQVIEEVGSEMFVGLSCDTQAQVEAANNLSGLAYIGSGPAFPTQSKADADPVIGPEGIKHLVQMSNFPVVAIGGITEANVTELAETGVAGVSVISVIAQSDNIARTVAKLKSVDY